MFVKFAEKTARNMATEKWAVGVTVVDKAVFALFYDKSVPGKFVRIYVSEDDVDVYDKQLVDADVLELVVRFLDVIRLYHRFPDRSREERLPSGTMAKLSWTPGESPVVKYYGPLSGIMIATSDWCGLVNVHDTVGSETLIEIAEYAKKIQLECREVDGR